MNILIKRTILGALLASVFMGIGAGIALALLIADDPDFIIVERWRTITTAPPPPYIPTTPFSLDPNMFINELPTTTTTAPLVPTTLEIIPETTTTSTMQPETTTTAPPETTSSTESPN